VQCVSFGRVYQESLEESEFSKLLKNVGFQEQPPVWKLANVEELGIRRWFFPQHVSYTHGKIAADAYLFSQWVKFNELDPAKAREEAARLLELIQKGDPWEVKQYVAHLQQSAASK
jgi:transposase